MSQNFYTEAGLPARRLDWVDAGARADAVEKLLAGDAVISVQVLNELGKHTVYCE